MTDSRTSNQLAWLVERQENGRAIWCTPNYQWTTDANEAAWFVRKQDAELFCWNLSDEAKAVEHMFCSAPAPPVEPITSPKEVIESLIRFAQHAPLCLISQWQPVDEEDFDCPDCTCGLTLLEQHGKQLAARLSDEPAALRDDPSVLREYLRVYGGHIPPCAGRPCECGFQKAWEVAGLSPTKTAVCSSFVAPFPESICDRCGHDQRAHETSGGRDVDG